MTNPIEPEIIVIERGKARLGIPDCPSEATFPHRWTATDIDVPTFGIAKTTATVREYLAFADQSGYAIDDQLRSDKRFSNPQAPAAYTSWIDAIRYTQWLARLTGKPYRLVRDAEYEKASRGGLVGMKFPWGDEDPMDRADFANPDGSPMPVGSYPANGYGLHDMVGSMYCWCEECFEQVVPDDPAKMCYEDTKMRDVRLNAICRSGSYKTADPASLYCAFRHEDPSEGRYDCIGFRVALSISR
jgi:formylglycine-generating enzyme required for sulfatase activity